MIVFNFVYREMSGLVDGGAYWLPFSPPLEKHPLNLFPKEHIYNLTFMFTS